MITAGSVADNDVARRRLVAGAVAEDSDDVEDTGVAIFGRPLRSDAYVNPLRNEGGKYVTPNSGCTQNGQAAGSETSWTSWFSCRSASLAGVAAFESESACSGG